MASLLVMLSACFAVPDAPPAGFGFVYQPAFKLDDEVRPPLQGYVPQAGDMFFSTDKMWIIRAGHAWAGANAPHDRLPGR